MVWKIPFLITSFLFPGKPPASLQSWFSPVRVQLEECKSALHHAPTLPGCEGPALRQQRRLEWEGGQEDWTYSVVAAAPRGAVGRRSVCACGLRCLAEPGLAAGWPVCILHPCRGRERMVERWADSRLDSPRSVDEGAQWLALWRKGANIFRERGGEHLYVSRVRFSSHQATDGGTQKSFLMVTGGFLVSTIPSR